MNTKAKDLEEEIASYERELERFEKEVEPHIKNEPFYESYVFIVETNDQ